MRMTFAFTPDELKNNHSGTYLRELRKNGFEEHPIVTFGEYEYIIMHTPTPRPGVQTIDVINVTDFESGDDPYFRVARDGRNSAFLGFEDEGFAMLAITKDGNFYEFANPTTAVLTYQIVPATSEQLQQTADQLDDELQANGPRMF